ncbi:MAG: exosortase/archaeosortase family protein [Pirellulales bacterium]
MSTAQDNSPRPTSAAASSASTVESTAAGQSARPWSERIGDDLARIFSKDNDQLYPALLIGALLGALLYAYWNTLEGVSGFWTDEQYSWGGIVPVFTIVVLWLWRKPIGAVANWERWLGAGVICLALGLRVLFGMLFYNTPGMATFPLAILGVFLMVGGLHTLKWSAMPILFLLFMFPLPMKAEDQVLKKLNEVAVKTSTYSLQTLGVQCYRQGNTITVDQMKQKLNVIDQCSGLRMATIFVALAVGWVMLVPMDWWERIVILVFALPIAVAVNVARIVITGLLYLAAEHTEFVTEEMAKKVFHDLAGLLMMPAALLLLLLLQYVMSRLIVAQEVSRPSQVKIRPRARVGTLVGK